MPRTYDELRLRYSLGPDVADPEQNILAGTAYLKELYERFGHAGMFAAYNAGPARYQAYLDGRLPLPDETKAYLATLDSMAAGALGAVSTSSGSDLYFPLTGSGLNVVTSETRPAAGTLFVPLKP